MKKTTVKDIAARRSDLYFLTHETILVEPDWNSRSTFTGIPELAADIAANGLLQPLRIRNEDSLIYLVDGERRHRAIGYAIEKGLLPRDYQIPITLEKATNLSDRLFSQLSANTGVPFTLMEKARLYARLRALEIPVTEIARRSQASKQSVYQALNIIDKASPHLIALIDAEKISATFALDIITQHTDHATQDATAEAALEAATQSGHTKATAKNAPKESREAQPSTRPTTNPSHPSEDSPTSEPVTSDPTTGDEDDEPPTTVETGSRKDTVNPPPNPSAYEGLKNADTTHRDGTSGNGPSGYAPPDKRIKNLDEHLDKFHYEGKPEYEAISTNRLNTIEIILDYLRGDHDIKMVKRHLQCKDME